MRALPIIASLAFMAAFGTASAQDTEAPAAAPALVQGWSEPQLGKVLEMAAASGPSFSGAPERPVVDAANAEGLRFRLMGQGCQGETCTALIAVMGIGLPEGADANALAAAFNAKFVQAKFQPQGATAVLMTRYILIQGGVSEENLAANLAQFLAIAAAAQKEVSPAG